MLALKGGLVKEIPKIISSVKKGQNVALAPPSGGDKILRGTLPILKIFIPFDSLQNVGINFFNCRVARQCANFDLTNVGNLNRADVRHGSAHIHHCARYKISRLRIHPHAILRRANVNIPLRKPTKG